MALRLEVLGANELRAALRRFGAEIQDMGPLWDRLGELMVEIETEQFESEGRGSWPPLAQSTLDYKDSHGYPPDPLIRTGDLFESLIDPERAMSVDQGRTTLGTFTSKSMTWGTDVEYSIYHQGVDELGQPTDYGGDPPRRPVIDVGPAEEARFFEAAEDFARDVLRRSGLEPR